MPQLGQEDMGSGNTGAVCALPDATAQAAVFNHHTAVRALLAGSCHCRLSNEIRRKLRTKRAGIETRLRKQRRAFCRIAANVEKLSANARTARKAQHSMLGLCGAATGCDCVLARVRCNAHTALQSPTEAG